MSSINERYPESELTSKIIGCAMEVHNALGNGFQEVIYQRAMAIEMATQNLSFSREHEMNIYYKTQNIGTRRVDFFVEGKIMVELKSDYSIRRCSPGTSNQLSGSIQHDDWLIDKLWQSKPTVQKRNEALKEIIVHQSIKKIIVQTNE